MNRADREILERNAFFNCIMDLIFWYVNRWQVPREVLLAHRHNLGNRGRDRRRVYLGAANRDRPVVERATKYTIGCVQRCEGDMRVVVGPRWIDIQLHPGLARRGHLGDLLAGDIDDSDSAL